jgi:alpha-L-arabinofuranosidase
MSAHDTQETNSIDDPARIVPVESTLHDVSSHFHHMLPAYSIQAIEFDVQ